MIKKLIGLELAFFAAASVWFVSQQAAKAPEEPVAILATGTNGGEDVYGETSSMIKRLGYAGYRVVVVPPRNASAAENTINRDLRPLRTAVLTAARDNGVEVIEPRQWNADGFHISRSEAISIGRRFAGAATFGDSNSVAINEGTGGHCFGVGGMTTTQILATQVVPTGRAAAVARATRQPCR